MLTAAYATIATSTALTSTNEIAQHPDPDDLVSVPFFDLPISIQELKTSD